MGLTNFWKKKASDQLAIPPLDPQQLSTDLPAIDGDSAGISVDGSSVQTFGDMQPLPTLDDSKSLDGSKSISFNVPTFDFSLPPNDDAPQTAATPELSATVPAPEKMPSLDEEDINHLFINDDAWKEPDWNTFEPYTEDKIDEPKPEDFNGAELPAFGADELPASPMETYDTVVKPGTKPLELFIRGRAYNRVFAELDQMSSTLRKVDSQLDSYEEMLKREEPLLAIAKDQMEYLYKRLNQVDKKIFAQ